MQADGDGPAGGPVLELRSVSKRWPGVTRPVIDGASLAVSPGEVVFVEGDNGSGKTTLMRLIGRVLDPDAGDILVTGLRAAEAPQEYARRLGLAASGNGGLYARLTVERHLRFSARLELVERARRPQRIADAVERFELGAFLHRRADRLSLGQRQRVRLALAFLHEPVVAILDEPEASLDLAGRARLAEVVERHGAAGGSVVWLAPTGDRPPPGARRHLHLADGGLRAA